MSKGPYSIYPNYLPTYSIHFSATHHVTLCQGNNKLYFLRLNANETINLATYPISGMNSSYQVRTYYYNGFGLSNNTFLIFTSSQIKVYKNNLANSSVFFNVANISGEIVSDVLFSKSSFNEIYLLLKNNTLGNYTLIFYNNSILITKKVTQVPTSSNYIGMEI